MKRFKIPETGDNVILKSKKTADYKEVKIVEVEDEFYRFTNSTNGETSWKTYLTFMTGMIHTIF